MRKVTPRSSSPSFVFFSSMSIRAIAETLASPNTTALGPSSSLSKPLSFEPSSTARRASVFFTTSISTFFSWSLRRSALFLLPVIPRGLTTATPSTPFSRSLNSRVMRFLTFLLIFAPSF